ncbi:trehalose operon repressor [Periweissella cryptocerci]|uniref:Trehalose operon repressor n=1 Tax=Periweissella cryptocerci TaxID=2506420 RepID=A0A4P6YRD6_9LACO|nr:trehalose operon repressor [Periweissella cryptocerci]QBO35184.1 trehalose operon repressor [Periweissella cryptocerci]
MLNKHEIIYRDLTQKIVHGIYQKGDLIPSENELCELYGGSRETIRKAVKDLNENGFVQTIRGKGSIVLDLERFVFPVSGLTSYKELDASLHMHSATRVIGISDTLVPAAKFEFATELDLAATYIERVRVVHDEPIVVDRDYLLKDVVTAVPLAAAQNSLYEYVEHDLGLEVSYARKIITVEQPDTEVQDLLELTGNEPVVIVRSEVHLNDTTLFQFTESLHRIDKFKFTDFARRHVQ